MSAIQNNTGKLALTQEREWRISYLYRRDLEPPGG